MNDYIELKDIPKQIRNKKIRANIAKGKEYLQRGIEKGRIAGNKLAELSNKVDKYNKKHNNNTSLFGLNNYKPRKYKPLRII